MTDKLLPCQSCGGNEHLRVALEQIVALRGYQGEDQGRVSDYRVAAEIAEEALRFATPPVDGVAEQPLTDLRRFVNLIEGRAMACDGPVTPFLEELNASSDDDKERFIGILRALYALAEVK